MFSTWGIHGSSCVSVWPFFIIIIGSPLTPLSDQGFGGVLLLTVLPNLIVLPHLPSIKISPS